MKRGVEDSDKHMHEIMGKRFALVADMIDSYIQQSGSKHTQTTDRLVGLLRYQSRTLLARNEIQQEDSHSQYFRRNREELLFCASLGMIFCRLATLDCTQPQDSDTPDRRNPVALTQHNWNERSEEMTDICDFLLVHNHQTFPVRLNHNAIKALSDKMLQIFERKSVPAPARNFNSWEEAMPELTREALVGAGFVWHHPNLPKR